MTEQEERLLHIIREGNDPAALMMVALEAMAVCLRQSGPPQAQILSAPASDGETC